MFSEDYLIRRIRQATAVLASVIGLKSTGQAQETLHDIDQALEQALGMDADIIRALDDESLYNILMKNEGLDLEKLEFIADLFKEKGDIHRLQDRTKESTDRYLRCLNYYLTISIHAEAAPALELSQKIEAVLQKLESYPFEEKTLLDLFCYYENAGAFARADAMLSRLAARSDPGINAGDEMRSFYQRLIEKSPQELAAGGMSLAQVGDKLKELETQK